MKEGDIIKIKGRLGFLMNPEMKVIKISKGLVTLARHPKKEGGLLSQLNETTHGVDFIKSRISVPE